MRCWTLLWVASTNPCQVPGETPGGPIPLGWPAIRSGIMKQICIVDLSIGRTGYSDLYILVNPKITWRSKGRVTKPEGCVNFPDLGRNRSRRDSWCRRSTGAAMN
jgi:hypothetical protein